MGFIRRFGLTVAAVAALTAAAVPVAAEVYLHETFDTLSRWVNSRHRDDYGAAILSAGTVYVDSERETGLQLSESVRFYALSTKLPQPVSNDGRDFVVSFSVKTDQELQCGGEYIKLLSDLDQADFHGDSPYWLMFGPDICGPTNTLHIIFNYSGRQLHYHNAIEPVRDRLTHVYTLHIKPDATYSLYIDGVSKAEGRLDEDWGFLPPKTIPDPTDKKPEGWVEAAMIPDPNSVKPADWDDEPALIADPTAAKPDDWNDAEDGEWEPEKVPNPRYLGKWAPKMIPNPDYKGAWRPREIPNPDYKWDPNIYRIPKPLQYVGIEVWQVQGGSIFDNIVLGDNIDEVLAIVKETYTSMAQAERAARVAYDEEMRAKRARGGEEPEATPRDDNVSDEEADL